ncbi:hypothetical protein [Paraburkholderia hospita]|uniref:hypothetical protein n=1 Tax=Paraburkholderia hospita TaxID=169430 RepID=UPI003ECE67D9
MKAIRDLSKTITTRQKELDRLNADEDRAEAVIHAADEAEAAVAAARRHCDTEAADAFLSKREPNPAFNAELDRAEQQAASLRPGGSAARGALAVIETRRTELREELAAAREELTALALEDVAQRRAKVQAAFNAAVDALREPLEDLSAFDGMTMTLRGTFSQWTGSRMLLDALKEDGLRVMTDRGVVGPAWFGTVAQAGQEKYKALADEFRVAGLDI